MRMYYIGTRGFGKIIGAITYGLETRIFVNRRRMSEERFRENNIAKKRQMENYIFTFLAKQSSLLGF